MFAKSTLRVTALLIVVAIVPAGYLLTRSKPVSRLEVDYFSARAPMVIAHRGGDELRPGNTMLAFDNALSLGADALEMDVRATRDGVLVVIHDATVDRTTNGVGQVSDLTANEIARLDAAYHWPFDETRPPYRGLGVRVPRLRDVLRRYPETRINVEIKQAEPSIVRRLCRLLRQEKAGHRTLVASFHASEIYAFREACRDVATSAVRAEVIEFLVYRMFGATSMLRPRAHALQLPQRAYGITLADKATFDAARAAGLHVDIWTVNSSPEMARLVGAGVGGIITGRPDLLLEMLSRRD